MGFWVELIDSRISLSVCPGGGGASASNRFAVRVPQESAWDRCVEAALELETGDHLLRLMARFATLLDKPNDAKGFNELADRLVVPFNKTYFHETTGRYSNGSQTSSVLPLAFGLVAEEDRQRVSEALVRKIQDQSQGHTGTGLIGGQ